LNLKNRNLRIDFFIRKWRIEIIRKWRIEIIRKLRIEIIRKLRIEITMIKNIKLKKNFLNGKRKRKKFM
jgi:hypothetical protein